MHQNHKLQTTQRQPSPRPPKRKAYKSSTALSTIERKGEPTLVISQMKKLKPLSPSLRERKRYVVIEVMSKYPLLMCEKISRAIEESMLSLIGSEGFAKAGVLFLHQKYDSKKQRAIARVSHTSVDTFIASCALVTDIEHNPVIVRALGVSGILKKAVSKFI